MEDFTRKAIHAIQHIPIGKVMTYGQIAAYAGSPRGARQVARLLHTMSSKYNLPWHRVINAEGKISIQDEVSRQIQEELLKIEGIDIKETGIDLLEYRYDPKQDLL